MSIRIALARQGWGKTWYLGHMVRQRVAELGAKCPPVLIHDIRCKDPKGWRKGTIGCLAPPKHRYPRYQGKLTAPVTTFFECPAEHLFQLAWYRRLKLGKGTILVIDELDKLPPVIHPQRHPQVYACIHYGRVYPIDILGTARRPQNIDKALLSEAELLAIGRIQESRALEALRRGGWLDSQTIDRIPKLNSREFITVRQ